MRRKALQLIHPAPSSDCLSMQSNLPPQLPGLKPPLLEIPAILSKCNSDLDVQALHRTYSSPHTNIFKSVLRSKLYFYIISLVTFLSFILDDLRVVTLPKDSDTAVDGLLFLFLGLFCGDVVLKWLGSEGYAGSVECWMDVTSSVGLLGEVAVVYQAAFGECETRYYHRLRICVRSARLSNLMIKLVRYLNLNKVTQSHPEDEKHPIDSSFTPMSPITHSRFAKASSVLTGLEDPSAKYEQSPRKGIKRQSTDTPRVNNVKNQGTLHLLYQQNKIRERLKRVATPERKPARESKISKTVTRKLVGMMAGVGVMLGAFGWMMAVVAEKGWNGTEEEYALGLIDAFVGINSPHSDKLTSEYINHRSNSNLNVMLIDLSVQHISKWHNLSTDLRHSERCFLNVRSVEAEFSISKKLKVFAIFDLSETILLCMLFFYVCLDVTTYIRNMILFPLERMVETVRLIWKNPLKYMKSSRIRKTNPIVRKCWESKKDFAEEETKLLENAFEKIGIMLGLVYGSAGSEMITSSIGVEGEFTPIVPGKAILAVFCFAKIGDFDWALDTLGPGILAYINLISGFVHSTAEQYLGSVNRNLGDSYLLVWKFQSDDGVVVDRKLVLNPYSSVVRSTTSLALMFAIKAISKVTANKHISRYRGQIAHPGCPSESILTFGFHVGWAYEGPIGSAYKIDASYLSPNVNMAARVATAALQYIVSILFSYDVYIRLEDEIRAYVRHIDTVKLRGVFEPVLLYSFDVSDPHSPYSPHPPTKHNTQQKRKRLKQALEEGLITVSQIYIKSETLANMRRHYPAAFFPCYEAALDRYLQGHWREAHKIFSSECVALVPFDGPTRTLMDYIEAREYRAPVTWKGVRELVSK